MSLRSEIFEQPEALRRLLGSQREVAAAIASAMHAREVRSVFVAARGTSDNAALYGKYLWGSMNRLPVALATPSLFSVYGTPPRLDGALVVGISQSGQSPDIVAVVSEGRAQGCLTLAITNDPGSPLAAAADLVLETMAGPERAVAATKTYTTQLLAIALLCASAREMSSGGDHGLLAELERLPALVERALELEGVIERAVERFRYMERCVVLGRGFNYATAYEWALKLKEMTYVVAEPYSSADFRHGPVAMVSDGFPVLAVAPRDAVLPDLVALMRTLVEDHRAELLVLSDATEALAVARTPLELPTGVPPWLSPVVAIVPAQLFCYHLTRAKGYDTEAPRQLQKVTRTL
jgi:glucosamine--fructose-6-phosphate aminotransferase (isomerizing)